ncbi:hypothetical protein [Burkholderia gladioli]|uniref:hypothetical protein n=1 Tax=Burkholderia gladioli TaxID=28095 RepID=UPI001640CAE0|nr:hypothetical protein [Burkholderia gladioli]
MNIADLMIVDPAGLDTRELRDALRSANQQLIELAHSVQRYEKAIAFREQVGAELIGFVEGVLKAHIRGDMGEVAAISDAYFAARPNYRERLEEDIEHHARRGAH